MRRGVFLIFLLATSLLRGEIVKVEIDGVIDPITSEFIQGAVQEAQRRKAEFLLIRLATPGGLGVSMQEIIQEILNSTVPVVCFVAPKGSHAASAGFLILLSADVAAMAPGTNTGAAHPVFPFGMDNKVMLEKVKNDILANLRSIMEERNRNYDLAQKGVEESKSFTAKEALEGGLIDLMAHDEEELLRKLDGFEVTRFAGGKVKLRAQGQSLSLIKKTFRQEVLAAIANPNLALVLGVLGLLGLYLEFHAPGMVFPGVAGAICLVLSLLGFSLLPVNYVGVLLILLSIGLFIAEVMVQGFGILGIGGAISLVLGLLVLVDSPYPDLRIGLEIALAVALPFALIFMFLLWVLIKNQGARVATGKEGLEGMIGLARTPISREGGKVFVHGEWWRAVASGTIESGRKVRVIRVNNLTLLVEPYSDDSTLFQRGLGTKS
ncbi:MAG: nodulation protein NfeD [Acidobacteriota bacterium]